jgi:hypothetical protein
MSTIITILHNDIYARIKILLQKVYIFLFETKWSTHRQTTSVYCNYEYHFVFFKLI